jgi:hypothetical protein
MNNEKFILGADFLNNYKANLQFGQGKESLFLEQTPTTVYARSIRSFQIKPNLEGHIEVELPSYLNNKDVLISPFDHSKQQFATQVRSPECGCECTKHCCLLLVN